MVLMITFLFLNKKFEKKITYLNLSWPAVSHNCNFILVPSFTSINLAKKSTPTVGSES